MNANNLHESESQNFIQSIISKDLSDGHNDGRVALRFPPEPNGYLHIGHAKSICLNFGLAKLNNGTCNLRFDDTNPVKEDTEYVESIQEDIKWLGFDWEDRKYFASDYFEQLFNFAVQLIESGHAYVCDLDAEKVREYRGTLTEPGKDSPCRDRSIKENLKLFLEMKEGKHEEGSMVLRAKIDMTSPNMNMRDPTIYRIRKVTHHRTGDTWCIYPMYDFAHGLSDSIEKITHSVCTLEFEDHRPLYNWFLEVLNIENPPQQIEFARLNLSQTVMSKRKLLTLVDKGFVQGWDDPRMPTIAGLRRRGFTPESIRDFCDRIGVSKAYNVVDLALLEHCLREDLNKRARRIMAVLDPLKVVITNYPEDQEEILRGENNPEDSNAGERDIPFSREIFIEKSDFMENAPKKYFRLSPGKEVRLKHAYYITCQEVIKDSQGEVVELRCTFDPKSRGGWTDDGRKVKGTLHWVSSKHGVPAKVQVYDHLFDSMIDENTDSTKEFTDFINSDSLEVLENCLIEPEILSIPKEERLQFLRTGYFCFDKDSSPEKLILNRAVSLKDSWSKKKKK